MIFRVACIAGVKGDNLFLPNNGTARITAVRFKKFARNEVVCRLIMLEIFGDQMFPMFHAVQSIEGKPLIKKVVFFAIKDETVRIVHQPCWWRNMKVRSEICVFLYGVSNFGKLTGFCRKDAFVFSIVENSHKVFPRCLGN